MSENPHYADRSDDETTPQTGGGVEAEAGQGGGDDPQVGGITDGPGSHGDEPEHGHGGHAQEAGTALAGEDAPHPAGDDARSARDVGGPKAADDAPRTEAGEAGELPGGAKGDIQTKGFEAH